MSIIACPHMGHSFLLLADIHQMPGNHFILLILAGRCRWQLPSGPRAHAPRSPSVCLDRRRALLPRLRGAAELKFLPTKRTFLAFVYIDKNDPRLNSTSWNGRKGSKISRVF